MSLMPEEDFNDEIVEIFIEEIDEVLALVDSNFSIWKDNVDADGALKEIRRGFHTLKGSGRMVHAEEIGEVAWAVENLLNRILDKTLDISPAVFELITEVRGAVPTLVEAFKNRQAAALSGVNYALLVERAENILSGKEQVELSSLSDVSGVQQSGIDDKSQPHSSVDVQAQQKIQELVQQVSDLKHDLITVSTQLDNMSAKLNLIPKATTTQEVDGKLQAFDLQISTMQRQFETNASALAREAEEARQKLSSKFEADLKNVADLTGQLKADFNHAASQLSAQANAIAIRWSVLAAAASGVCVYVMIKFV